MKKYLLFAGSSFPKGGFKDYVTTNDDSFKLREHWDAHKTENLWNWMHIVERDTGQIIEQRDRY
jgi:hypothetical protein